MIDGPASSTVARRPSSPDRAMIFDENSALE
jgi:hypothetical protein